MVHNRGMKPSQTPLADLVHALLERGVPQNVLARLLGVDKGYWSRLVADRNRLERFLRRRLTPDEEAMLRIMCQDPRGLERATEALVLSKEKGRPLLLAGKMLMSL